MRNVMIVLTGVALAVGGCTEAGEAPAVEARPTGDFSGPADQADAYTFRLDSRRSDPGEFILTEAEEAVRIQTGPAGVAYHASDRIDSGDFHVEATFRQFSAPVGYREAYGLFVGGRDLTNDESEYTYLLVRPTGDFMVKRRVADITETLVDWTPHESVSTVQAEGDEPVNTLAIDVIGGETRFMVNGAQVHAMPTAEARPHGVSGLRVNHRLDVRITDWAIFPTIDES